MAKRIILAAFLALAGVTDGPALASSDIQWRDWSPDVFSAAAKEHKLVLLDLGAVWCHWCHVMDETTYRDPAIVSLVNDRYVPVRVDEDAYPDLAAAISISVGPRPSSSTPMPWKSSNDAD